MLTQVRCIITINGADEVILMYLIYYRAYSEAKLGSFIHTISRIT